MSQKKVLEMIYILSNFCIFLLILINAFVLNYSNIKVLILGLGCLFLYLINLFHSKKTQDRKYVHLAMVQLFFLYIILLCNLTLFDRAFGRSGLNLDNWNLQYAKNHLNLVPFKTIFNYMSYSQSIEMIKINILGNLFAFTPFAFFLPLIFYKQNNFKIFLATMILIVLTIETLQLIFQTGSWDIDDLILNVLGACIMFSVLKISKINDLINKLLLK